MSHGFGYVTVGGYTAFKVQLGQGAWAAVPAMRGKADPASLPLEVWWKVRLTGAVEALVRVEHDEPQVEPHVARWERAQRRLAARTRLDIESDDPAVAEAAGRVRGGFLQGEGTAQNAQSREAKVTYGRAQRVLAEAPAYAADLKRLGYEDFVREVVASTEALAAAIGYDAGAAAGSDRKRRRRAALGGCVAAFNAVFTDLEALLARGDLTREARARLEALHAPLARMLERAAPTPTQEDDAEAEAPAADPQPLTDRKPANDDAHAPAPAVRVA